jgi:hypothetical protein
VERRLERRDELLKLVERQAREIQELYRAGLQLSKPCTSHGSYLLSLERDIRGASYQKESGINSDGDVLAMQRRAMELMEIAEAGNALKLTPGGAAWVPVGADVAASQPTVVGTI